MPATLLYCACLASAAGLYLLMRGRNGSVRGVGTIIGLGGLAWLLSALLESFGPLAGDVGPLLLPLIFGTIAIASAVRVITHHRPVIAALFFVLVVVATAAMFLSLHAEFMAFALIIVYAGAILITYLFVLMLAQQSPNGDGDEKSSWYDRTPREPAIAILAGFIMLVGLIEAMDDSKNNAIPTPTVAQAQEAAWNDLDRLPRALLAAAQDVKPTTAEVLGPPLVDENGGATIAVRLEDDSETTVKLTADQSPSNTRRVGLSLVADFPVSLEMAGVILLMAMFGAVVLARKQFEYGEDETRAAMQEAADRSNES